MRYRVKVTVEFNLDANPSDPYAAIWAHKTLSGEYISGDVTVHGPEWLPWCTHLPPEFEDGMLVMPPDVNGDGSYTLLSQIRGPIKVHHENLGVYEGLESGIGLCVNSKAFQEKVGGFCEANKDGVEVVSTTNARDPVGHGG